MKLTGRKVFKIFDVLMMEDLNSVYF
jgi:hypothetical protein